jgi:hypothetical protein
VVSCSPGSLSPLGKRDAGALPKGIAATGRSKTVATATALPRRPARASTPRLSADTWPGGTVLFQGTCAFEPILCRRIIVEAAADELINLEVLAVQTQDAFGVMVEPFPFQFLHFKHVRRCAAAPHGSFAAWPHREPGW